MNKTELKLKAMQILSEHLSAEEFDRCTINVGKSEAQLLEEIKLQTAEKVIKSEELKAANIAKSASKELHKYVEQLAQESLDILAKHVGVNKITTAPAAISIAQYYIERGSITPKQKQCILNYYSV